MPNEISEYRKRSNAFLSNIRAYMAEAVEESKEGIIKLNQKQLQASKLATGNPITPLYSNAYAKLKGYSKPDGYLTGEMYAEMDLYADENRGVYHVISYADHTKYFVGRYGHVFGVAPYNYPRAQKLTTAQLQILYRNKVYKK